MLLLFLWFSLIIELYRRIAINETLSYEHCEDDLQAYEWEDAIWGSWAD